MKTTIIKNETEIIADFQFATTTKKVIVSFYSLDSELIKTKVLTAFKNKKGIYVNISGEKLYFQIKENENEKLDEKIKQVKYFRDIKEKRMENEYCNETFDKIFKEIELINKILKILEYKGE